MIRTIEVPAAGQSETFGISGRSIIVVNAPAYYLIEDVPLLSFNAPGSQLPALTRSIFGFPDGKFQRLAITGTAESAGDEITIMSTLACLDDYINIDALQTSKAIAGNTTTVQMDDTVHELTALQLVNDDGKLPKSIYISAGGTGDIHYRWNDGTGSDPAAGGDESYVLSPGDEPIEIEGIDFIQNKLKFINAVAAETPYFIYTPRY